MFFPIDRILVCLHQIYGLMLLRDKHIILGVVSILWVVLKYFRFHSKDLVFDVTDVVYTLSFKSLRTHSFIHSVDLRFTKTDFCHGYCGANLVDLLLNHKNAGMQITHTL